MHRRIRTLAFTAALSLSLTLAACGGGGGDEGGEAGSNEAASKRGPITVWYSNNEQEVAWGKAMVQAWNAAHPDEQVEGQEIPAGKSSEEVIGAAITAGTAPCLVFNTAPSAVGQFQRQGGLVDLTTFPDGKAYVEERSGDVAQQYQTDGSYYQLPWKSNPVMIFYNKDLFTKAGLDPENPKLSTYAEFLAAATKIKDSKAAKYAIYPAPTSEFFQTQFDFMPLVRRRVRRQADRRRRQGYVQRPGRRSRSRSSGSRSTARAWPARRQLQGDPFADKVSAMAIVGPWAIAVYKDIDWGAVPVPTSAG